MNKLKIKIKSLDKKILFQYKTFLIKFLEMQNINFSYFALPTKTKKVTVLKSTHVYKKARDQFELKEYKLILNVDNIFNQSKMEILKNLLLNKPKILTLRFKIST